MLTLAKQTENQALKPSPTKASFFGSQGSVPFFQAKLTVNQPGDHYEQEADQVADQVMRMQEGDAPIVQRMPLTPLSRVQRTCAECEEKEHAQRKETGDAGGHSAPSIVSDVLSSGGGQPLEGNTRQFMESRMGQDFSQVRVHVGSRAAESANAIQARAYTSGQNVVFGSGEYQPGSDSGKRLLAHELVHVGQQQSVTGIQKYGKDGFSPGQESAVDAAVPKAIAKITKCTSLGSWTKKRILKRLDDATYKYKKDFDLCGYTIPFFRTIKLGDKVFNPQSCCDLESTLAHELRIQQH